MSPSVPPASNLGLADDLRLRATTPADVPVILTFIEELAEYERLRDECVTTEEDLHRNLFGERPYAEVVLAERRVEEEWQPVGFAMFFHNFSSFLGRPGLWLEDVFVRPSERGNGIGKALLQYLAQIALHRGCGRMEWWVLNWNEPSIRFYEALEARAMDEWTVYRLAGTTLDAMAEHGGPKPAT